MLTAEVRAKQQGTFGRNFKNLHFQPVSTFTCLKTVLLHHPEKKKKRIYSLQVPSSHRSDFHCCCQLAAADFVN